MIRISDRTAALAVKPSMESMEQSNANVLLHHVSLSMMQTTANKASETWFRFLVKQLKTTTSIRKPAYVWYEMGFFTHYTVSSKSTLLCFDVPDIFRNRLQESLNGRSETYSPYDLHSFVINEAVTLYDDSVWTIRDFVRDVENVSTPITEDLCRSPKGWT